MKPKQPFIVPSDPQRVREFLGVSSSATRFMQNPFKILEAQKRAVPFGLTFLNSALQGMLPTDLTGIGAKGGVGKTQLVTEIAKNMAMQKKKVLFIALEAEPNEIEMRLEFQLFASHWYYDKQKPVGMIFDYRSYRFGKLNEYLKKHADGVRELFHERYETLETVYKTSDFTTENFAYLMAYAKDNAFDCVVLDHAHYFDLYGEDSENQELSKMMKEIRDLNLKYSIPVIIVAHTRKMPGMLPGLEDFRGSSDIGKIITNCIMIAGRPNSYDAATGTVDTVIAVPKARAGGKLNVVGLMHFHIQMQTYVSDYRVGSINGEAIEELSRQDLPYWAKSDPFCRNKGDYQDLPEDHY